MSQPDAPLDRLQRWMQYVITHPEGIEAGMAAERARQQLDVAADQIGAVILPSQQLSSLDRLAVYANAYFARLLECLREEFPALQHALGEEVFDGFAFRYLQCYPSQSYTLSELGRNFSRHLEETRPPRTDDGTDWADFLIDLATLERLYAEVFDGPGIESCGVLRNETLAAISPEQWPDCQLVPAPCLRLPSLRFPAHEYIEAVRRGESPTIPAPAATHLVVTRREFVIRRFTVGDDEQALLALLVDGKTIGEAVQVAAARSIDPARLGSQLRDWFARWSQERLFAEVRLKA